ncbi:MAG: cell division protein FtsQ/DivIB [Rhodocyclaceae bacterium]|nr:cell division protein FtsQ/DivIB [Rhodocyclaceae bacterium]
MNLLADVLIVLAVAGLGWAGLTALQRLPVFPLRELMLTAAPSRIAAEQLEHAARSAMVGNFFTVDLEAARAAFEKLPWVRKAAVSRQWPDGLKLTLEEHEPVARWRHLNGDPALVNRQGELFVAEIPADPGLPQLSGPAGSARELLERYAEFSGVVAGIDRRIDSVALSPRRAWQLKLDDGVAVELGRDQSREQTGERLERFVTHYTALRQKVGAVHVADMRYPNGFVLSGVARARPALAESAGQKS